MKGEEHEVPRQQNTAPIPQVTLLLLVFLMVALCGLVIQVACVRAVARVDDCCNCCCCCCCCFLDDVLTNKTILMIKKQNTDRTAAPGATMKMRSSHGARAGSRWRGLGWTTSGLLSLLIDIFFLRFSCRSCLQSFVVVKTSFAFLSKPRLRFCCCCCWCRYVSVVAFAVNPSPGVFRSTR